MGGSASTGLGGNGGEDGNGNRAIGNVQGVDSCVDHIEVETSRMARTVYIGSEEVESSQTSADLIRRQERLKEHGVRYRTE